MRTDGDIPLRKHLLRFLPRKLYIVCHIAPQRSTDIDQLGAAPFQLRRALPECGQILTDGILQNGSRFETVKVFQHDGLTNLLFPFEDIQVDMGKLAMWRLQTHGVFGGTWLSDYVPNRLGGFRSARQENPRPLCPLLGQDGNIFHLMGIAARVLRQNGMAAEAKEMQTRIMGGACHSYEEALGIISEYVETELSPPRENRTKKKEKHEHER